jgi:hypothetical protein
MSSQFYTNPTARQKILDAVVDFCCGVLRKTFHNELNIMIQEMEQQPSQSAPQTASSTYPVPEIWRLLTLVDNAEAKPLLQKNTGRIENNYAAVKKIADEEIKKLSNQGGTRVRRRRTKNASRTKRSNRRKHP